MAEYESTNKNLYLFLFRLVVVWGARPSGRSKCRGQELFDLMDSALLITRFWSTNKIKRGNRLNERKKRQFIKGHESIKAAVSEIFYKCEKALHPNCLDKRYSFLSHFHFHISSTRWSLMSTFWMGLVNWQQKEGQCLIALLCFSPDKPWFWNIPLLTLDCL